MIRRLLRGDVRRNDNIEVYLGNGPERLSEHEAGYERTVVGKDVEGTADRDILGSGIRGFFQVLEPMCGSVFVSNEKRLKERVILEIIRRTPVCR